MAGLDSRLLDRLEDGPFRDAVAAYFDLWTTTATPRDRMDAMGVDTDEFLDVLLACRAACLAHYGGGTPALTALALAMFGMGRQYGIDTALAAKEDAGG